ncbi:ABC transporter substrate-binding protein [Paenibacillus sp. 32O-W]|uniref:ABC transporter substrate-binding protein n=1 Tax=Paenibacillus sp. 32O-W TaxID=1695218 RepID=UPI0007227D27|nr:extracellular solute-binding protein [Paenibacillus sp. 32O-W]ALS29033.1 ABC transporter substrate-binding protein [Paenibacillus sp. 32O-W]
MKQMKVVMLFLLALVLIAAPACSKTEESETPPAAEQTGEQTEAESQTPEEEEPPAPEVPAIDMNGYTIKMVHWIDGPQEGTQEGDLAVAREKEIEEKYNVNIEWVKVPWGEPPTMITNAALAGEPVADMVALDLYHAIPLIRQGLLLPVDDLFDMNDPKWPVNMKENGSFEGKQYGFTDKITGSTGLYYNKTLFEREGLPDPHDLIEQDKWNWDSFLDIAKRATKDTDGDGVVDQWGMTTYLGNLTRLLVYSNNGNYYELKDGKYVFSHDNPNTLEALRFLGDLFNVHKVVLPNTHNSFDDYTESQTVFSSGKAAMINGELWEGAERKDMTDEQGFVYFPKGPKATEYSNTIENFVLWYMPANAKHPKETAQIWQDLVLWDRVENAKREDAEKQRLADEKDVELMVKITDIVTPFFNATGGAVGDAAWGIVNNGETPEAALERVKQVAQDSLDQNLNTKP